MKKETQLGLLLITMLIGIILIIWGNIIMRNYDGYLEIMRAARHAAAPQFISGIIILTISYILTFKIK
jgi:hypothetical protein